MFAHPAPVPCALCGAERDPHACPVSVVHPHTFSLVESDAGTFASWFPVAHARTVRDA
jgi:hypothetical protein